MNKPVAVVRKHTISGIDNFHVELFERLKEGTTLYTHPVKEQKCIVKDCENHKHEGGFVGDLCKPCHQFITTGEGIYSQAYRNSHPAKEQELLDEIEALKKQVVIWERSSKDRAIKLNICAIKVSELEKKLDTRTKELIGASFYEHDYKTMMVLDGNRVYPTVKELTDEEILEVWRENERVYPMDRSRLLDRTRACIKKASEK